MLRILLRLIKASAILNKIFSLLQKKINLVRCDYKLLLTKILNLAIRKKIAIKILQEFFVFINFFNIIVGLGVEKLNKEFGTSRNGPATVTASKSAKMSLNESLRRRR